MKKNLGKCGRICNVYINAHHTPHLPRFYHNNTLLYCIILIIHNFS